MSSKEILIAAVVEQKPLKRTKLRASDIIYLKSMRHFIVVTEGLLQAAVGSSKEHASILKTSNGEPAEILLNAANRKFYNEHLKK